MLVKNDLVDHPESWEGVKIRSLRQDCSGIPPDPGVYCVLYNSQSPPELIDPGTGGRFKDRDPNVPIMTLQAKWVIGATILYVGKSKSIKQRVERFIDFGNGKRVSHWGGRYIWQIKNSGDLVLCWKQLPKEDDSFNEEWNIVSRFVGKFHQNPFGNISTPKGRRARNSSSIKSEDESEGMRAQSNSPEPLLYNSIASIDRFLHSIDESDSRKVNLVSEIGLGEGERTEFKAGFFSNVCGSYDITEGCLRTIAAFSNRCGGKLLIGVSDNGEPIGIEEELAKRGSNLDHYIREIMDRIEKSFFNGLNVSIGVRIDPIRIKDKLVCKIDIPKARDPVYLLEKKKNMQLEKRFLVRRGPSNKDITDDVMTAIEYARQHFYTIGTDDCR